MKQEPARSLPAPIDFSSRIGIIHSSYYGEEVGALVAGARRVLLGSGLPPSSIKTYAVPGSFEIPLLGAALAEAGEVEALIGLGVIVEGQTHHARLIAEQAARGMMEVQLRHGIPFAFEVLYVDDLALARARLDRGEEAARAVLQFLAQLRSIGR